MSSLSSPAGQVAVALERGPQRRVFAQASDWIGWRRAGKDEAAALSALVMCAPRYARVAECAGTSFSPPASIEELSVVERLPGTATTDFGALSVLPGVTSLRRHQQARRGNRLQAHLLKAFH